MTISYFTFSLLLESLIDPVRLKSDVLIIFDDWSELLLSYYNVMKNYAEAFCNTLIQIVFMH